MKNTRWRRLDVVQLVPEVELDDTLGYAIPLPVDPDLIRLHSIRQRRVVLDDLYIPVVHHPGTSDLDRRGVMLRYPRFDLLLPPMLSAWIDGRRKRKGKRTIVRSTWFGHIHFLSSGGISASGGSRQSMCQCDEQ